MPVSIRSGLWLPLFVVIASSGCERPPAPPKMPPAAVTVARPLSREVVDWDDYTGRLEAVEIVELRARVGGYLIEANFPEGGIVEEGKVLFRLDPAPFEAELAKAKAQVAQAQAQAENASTEFTRIQRLRESGGGSEKEFQDAKYNKLQTAAAVAAAQANERTAQLNLDWTQVKAPFRGRTSRKFVTEGNLITGGTASGTLLTTITKLDPIYCYVDADESSVLKYQRLSLEKKRISAREQQIPCFLQLGDEKGFPHEGLVDFVDNRVDPNTGTLRARGVFANTDGWLLPGLFGRLRVPGSGRYQTLLVPDAAVDTNQNIKFLRIVRPDNTVEFRNVTLGSLFGQLRSIESGLGPDERVVINGLQRAIPDSKVDPHEVELDPTMLQFTAPGSAATQSLPATRHLPPATGPTTRASR